MHLTDMPKTPKAFDHPRLVELDEDEPLVDKGLSLGLRLLAMLGALSFVMLGISSITPLLRQPPPPPMPDQRQAPMA